MRIERHGGTSATEHLSAFFDLYAEVYGVPPYIDDPFFSVEMYTERLRGAMAMRGFEIVTATTDQRLIGIGHGVTLPAGIPWWTSIRTSLPTHLVDAAEAGAIFWLRELQVCEPFRNKGVGRKLHDCLRAGRHEDYTTLTVIVDNEPARSAYLRWGYRVIGQIRHAPESPLYDAMVSPERTAIHDRAP